jgi:Uma2 family endonuclease
MGLPQAIPICSVDDYLAFERSEEVRHEYFDGQIYAMAGESLEHSTISANLIGMLHGQLKGKPCRALSPNMKVLSGENFPGQTRGLFSYPDVTVVCGEPKFLDGRRDVLLNPTVIVEVLSPGTESFDRGEKFQRYRKHLDSLQDFILVSSQYPLVELFQRQHGGFWLYSAVAEMEASLALPSIHCELPLVELYDRVEFPTNQPTDNIPSRDVIR